MSAAQVAQDGGREEISREREGEGGFGEGGIVRMLEREPLHL